jgi:hypothetical protein
LPSTLHQAAQLHLRYAFCCLFCPFFLPCLLSPQLATRKSAVLFDLLTLAPQHPAALDACLFPLFESTEVLKLGFGLTGDLAKLAGSWPDVQTFRVVAGVLDLRPLWVAYGMANRRQVGESQVAVQCVHMSVQWLAICWAMSSLSGCGHAMGLLHAVWSSAVISRTAYRSGTDIYSVTGRIVAAGLFEPI